MQTEKRKMKPVELLDDVHPQPFVLISKAYWDGISLRKDGCKIKKEFSSECIYGAEKTYRTAVTFIPKMVPKHFVTTLTVADELTYYESIVFERRAVLKNASVTTNVFLPKELKHNYYSALVFDPKATTRRYITGTELLPARKCVVIQDTNQVEESDSIEYVSKKTVNGDIHGREKLINGDMGQ